MYKIILKENAGLDLANGDGLYTSVEGGIKDDLDTRRDPETRQDESFKEMKRYPRRPRDQGDPSAFNID